MLNAETKQRIQNARNVLVGEVPLDYILKTLWTASGRSALMVSILDRRGEVLASPLLVTAPVGFKGSVWLLAAKQAVKEKRTDDARKYLNQVVDANAPQAQAAREQLKAMAS